MISDFRPLKGVGVVGFGMLPEQVLLVCGAPDSTGVNYEGEFEEHRGEWTVRYEPKNRRLVEITVGPSVAVSLGGVEFIRSGRVVETLSGIDQKPVETIGFLVFQRLGVAVTGYHDGDVSQRAVTFFEEGRWDDLE